MPARGSPAAVIVVVTVALFTDAFLYGLVIPLAPRSAVAGENAFTQALTYAAYGLGVLVATPIVGPLTDRVGRRLPFLLGLVCIGLATFLFATADSVPLVLFARLVQGIASTATWTAGLALVADTFVRKRTQMMGIAMMGSSAGSVLGPVVGGTALEIGGYLLPFVIGGVLLAVDGAMRLTLVLDRRRPDDAELPNVWALLRDRTIVSAALVVAAGAAGWSVIEPLLPDHLTQTAGVGPAAVGLMFTLSTAANGLSAPWIGNVAERYGLWRTTVVGVVLMALLLPALALPVPLVLVTGVLMLLNITYGMVMNPSLSELAEAVDRRWIGAYGAVYALYNVGYSVGQMGGNLLAGQLTLSVSFLGALMTMSALLLVSVPAIAYLRRPAATSRHELYPMRGSD